MQDVLAGRVASQIKLEGGGRKGTKKSYTGVCLMKISVCLAHHSLVQDQRHLHELLHSAHVPLLLAAAPDAAAAAAAAAAVVDDGVLVVGLTLSPPAGHGVEVGRDGAALRGLVLVRVDDVGVVALQGRGGSHM